MSGSARRAIAISEYAEMSSAVANASRGVSTKRFVNVSCGANAIGVHHDVEAAELLADLLERPVDAGVGRDVALDDDVGPGLLGELSHRCPRGARPGR